MRLNIYIVLLISLISSCSLIENNEFKQKNLARVSEEYLYESDLKGLIPDGTSYEDSVKIVAEFVDQWVRKQLLLEKAMSNVNEAAYPEIDKQVKLYKEDLIIHAYEEALVRSKVDTAISDEELKQYYDLIKGSFLLDELHLNVTCLAVNKQAPKIDSIRYWMRYPRGKFAEKIEDYSIQYAHFFSLDTNMWHSYDYLKNKLNPITIFEPYKTLQKRRYFEREDSTNKYFMRVFGYKFKGAEAPFVMVEDRVRQTILAKRKADYIENMNLEIYKKAFQKNYFEIYKEEDEQ